LITLRRLHTGIEPILQVLRDASLAHSTLFLPLRLRNVAFPVGNLGVFLRSFGAMVRPFICAQ
jgi:hypothetical protein